MRKYLLSMLVLSAVTFVFANGAFADGKDKDDHFAEHKQHEVHDMDLQISALQAAKSCFSSASDHEAMKHCREELERARKKIREEKIENQIHRLQEEKAKLDK